MKYEDIALSDGGIDRIARIPRLGFHLPLPFLVRHQAGTLLGQIDPQDTTRPKEPRVFGYLVDR